MANRPVYVPSERGAALVSRIDVEFKWFAGLAASQKQKSIRSLHEAASKRNIAKVLEISSKSEIPLGVSLSAFNLPLVVASGKKVTVETAFQAGKVFERGGPYRDILEKTSREAKGDPRLRTSGGVIRFEIDDLTWPIQPTTCFYDWLYLSALRQSPQLSNQLLEYDGFTDIEFNPERSLNSQAASAALFVSLSRRGKLDETMATPDAFLNQLMISNLKSGQVQTGLF
jgi:hypothetical protein